MNESAISCNLFRQVNGSCFPAYMIGIINDIVGAEDDGGRQIPQGDIEDKGALGAYIDVQDMRSYRIRGQTDKREAFKRLLDIADDFALKIGELIAPLLMEVFS